MRKCDEFLLGANYLASNAGINMWREFDPEVVERDFALLREYGMNIIRVFPLWPDFQPVISLHKFQNARDEVRYADETPLDDTPESDGVRVCCINPTETVRIDTLTPAVPATLEVISLSLIHI